MELLKCWIGLWRITISIDEHNISEVMRHIWVIGTINFMTKDQSEPVFFWVHGPIRIGPKGSGCSPPISWLVLDWLWLLVAPFGSQKPDWIGPLNTDYIAKQHPNPIL